MHLGLRPAARFLAASASGRAPDVARDEATLTLPDGERLPCDVYSPPRPRPGEVVFIHGMAWRAQRDPRIEAACRAIAGAGHRAWAPRIPDIADLRIRTRSTAQIAEVARAVAAEGGPVGLMSVSFSAGMAIAAAATPGARDRVSAVLAIGAFTDANRALAFLLRDPEADPYGRLIVLRDRLRLVIPVSEALDAALMAALHDQGHAPGPARLPAARAALGPADRLLLDRLCGPPAANAPLIDALLRALEPELRAFTITPEVAAGLGARVSLVHGRGDRVIPPGESEALHIALRAAGRATRLSVTTLISHGDTQPGPSAIMSLPSLFEALRFFFEGLARGAGLRPGPTRV